MSLYRLVQSMTGQISDHGTVQRAVCSSQQVDQHCDSVCVSSILSLCSSVHSLARIQGRAGDSHPDSLETVRASFDIQWEEMCRRCRKGVLQKM